MTGRDDTFKALVADRTETGFEAAVRHLTDDDLPKGDVLVAVAYSGLNYKDALAVADKGKILRHLPLVPGVDLVGTVLEAGDERWSPGDRVLVNGHGIGEDHWGGYTQRTRVRADWLIPVPDGLSLRHAAAVGTAGYTAALSVMTLEEHGVTAGDGEVVVTGASGGVGGFAVALLAHAGHQVVASTGRPELAGYLEDLGAAEILPRAVLGDPSGRPLGSERWRGAVDSVGGVTLANVIATTRRHGSVAACGLASGAGLATTVFPFILRGVNLLGIDSNYCPRDRRIDAWDRIARDVAAETIDRITQDVAPLEALPELSLAVLAGQVRGRIVVDLAA